MTCLLLALVVTLTLGWWGFVRSLPTRMEDDCE